jgi:hypothetical protein
MHYFWYVFPPADHDGTRTPTVGFQFVLQLRLRVFHAAPGRSHSARYVRTNVGIIYSCSAGEQKVYGKWCFCSGRLCVVCLKRPAARSVGGCCDFLLFFTVRTYHNGRACAVSS